MARSSRDRFAQLALVVACACCAGCGARSSLDVRGQVDEPPVVTPPETCGVLPDQLPNALGVVQVVTGWDHTCALTVDGTVRCWGNNEEGQLGDGTLESKSVPTEVPGLSGVVELAVGWSGTCAVSSDATLRCWGWESPTPTQVSEPSGVVQLDGPCALLGSGTVVCRAGELPIEVVEGVTNAVEISIGGDFGCARLADATVSCWGTNFRGQLGRGQASPEGNHHAPGPVPGLTDVVQIAAGWEHVCARHADESLRCWGSNGRGQLGPEPDPFGAPIVAPSPTEEPMMECGAELALGREHSCRRFTDGTVKCWGNGEHNRLGRILSNQNGFGYFDPVATEVDGVSDALAMAAGDRHGCAITSAAMLCWGANEHGQLGGGTVGAFGQTTTVLW